MSVEIVMPQMGESITEGTISKWLKKVGDKVEKDEAILEISTDKVDAEVPSVGAGVLLEIRHQEGETVEVGTVLALVGEEGSVSIATPPTAAVEAPVQIETPKVVEEVVAAASVIETPAPVIETPAAPVSAGDATKVVMPQMGESITEGTVSKWLKQVGDHVDRDEALLEISTDKVDAEIPSPAAGTLLAINVQEGQTVEVGTVIALVGAKGATAAPSAKPATEPEIVKPAETPKVEAPVVAAPVSIPAPIQVAAASSGNGGNGHSVDELRRTKSSPLVRNIAKQHGVDLSRIPGSGLSGRVTKKDILSFIETGAALRPQDLLVKPLAVPQITPQTGHTFATQPVQVTASAGDRAEPMSNMRKKIAERMVISKQTSAHVTSVYEIDMTNIVNFRQTNKRAFEERYGTKLTYMPFIFQGVSKALRQFPIINAQVSGDSIIYKGDVNLGMAVALDWGLIVPVIKRADQLSLAGLCTTANDLAERARTKRLDPNEVQDGTFTITNTGTFGGLFGTPIIPQPQVAILCFGTIEKRPKVMTLPDGTDVIAIRSMAYFALTYDHRIVDGADAEKFLAYLKNYLETEQFTL